MLLKLTRTSILLFFFCFTQSAIQAQEQLAIWTFPALSGISDGTQIFPTTDDVDGTPFLQQFNQDIDDNGTSGIAYTDQEGVMHPANDAIEWDDIKGSGADATLEITINTTGWEDIYLRFDYKSESANSFDLEYSVNGAPFIKPFNNESITADAALNTWYSKTLNLTSENLLENATSVLIRLNDFDRNGNDKLDLDNIELYGTKIAAPTGTPDLTVAATTTPFLSLSADGPGFVSGVIGDAADPAATFGIDFLLEDSDTPIADLSFSATSSNTAVVANSNLSITGINDARNLKITPSGVGYTTITVTLSDLDGNSDDYVIEYAASAALPPTSICHTGKSDASTAVAIDADYMFVADDEDEIIRLYDRDQPGLPLNSFNFASNLDKDGTREVDLEASIKIGNTIYWLGSHSNNSDGELRPNRSRLFSTTISGSGANATLSFGDFYKFLKDDLVAWDAGNGHGLGANFLNFTAATMDGVVPETANGFNIEGLALAPGSTTTAFLGFRAPVPGDAIIVPVTNFTSLPGNASAGAATFGAPIFLDLGGRGIRSIARNASDEYIIVAGPAGSAGAAPNNFQLFYWDGNAASSPEEIIATPALNTGISFESLVEVPNPLADGVQVQMLADNGDTDWYDDGMRSKDLAQLNFQKFCSGIFTLDVPTCDIAISGVAATDETCAGDVDGTITITATCTSCTSIQYSIDGGSTFQANNTFSGLPPDNYDIVVKDMGDASCTASTMETVNFGAPLPADPVAVQMSSEFCSNSGVGNGEKRVRIEAPAGANEGTIWILTDAPTGSQFDGMEPIEFAEGETNSEFRITGGSKGNTVTMRGEPDNGGTPVYGTWTFDVRVEDSNTGCSSGTETGYFITAFENPAAPIAATATKAFCVNPDLSASLANTGINVSNSLAANEKVVWVMTSAPANSPYSVETQLTTDDCGDPFKNLGTFAVANTSKVLRVNDIANAVPGTYTFDAYIENCETGCVSEVTSGFSITVNEMPSVMITADLPIGIGRDLCLGQEDVQYNAVVTSTDGGTYSYLWCAYNSGDGSGSCFNGFDNNTAQDPMRDWTSSAGNKSVSVTATSDVAGCEAEDLYSFEVVAPTMLECPDDIVATLITDPVTYDCATDITFNNPMVMPGPCDPVNLTIEITGPSGAGPEMVTPGEEYVFTVVELGLYTVTYNLVDAIGNTSTCSFDITVEGLPCGWVDNGGIGTCAGTNSSDYDLTSETFSVSSNGCVPEFPYTGDNQAFINTQLCGDGYIEVLVDNIAAKGFAGIALRESQAPGAKKVEIGTDNVARIVRAVRVIDNYPAFPQEILSFDKFWLKIERNGNSFRASASPDGINYTPYLFQTIMMGECLEAGLWAYSTNPEDVVTANFTNVTVEENGGILLQAPVTNLAQSQTDLGAFDVSLTPNPAQEQVSINMEQLIGQEVSIRLYNINGQLMQQQQLQAVEAATHRIDLSYLPKGAYWVQIQSVSEQKTMKLIKQ